MNPLDIFLPIWNPLVGFIQGTLLGLTGLTRLAGLAIIVFALTVRTLLIPLALIQARSQQRYAGNHTKIGQEQMRPSKEIGYNYVAGCLPLLVQVPIWLALYSALGHLAANSDALQAPFLWLPSLAHGDPYFILPALTGGTQWVVQRMSIVPTADPQQQQMNRMMGFMPLLFFFLAVLCGAGLALYWTVSNLYSIVQQRFAVVWAGGPQ